MNFLFAYDGKKGDLLKAGLELFATRGYDGVSVRDIAKSAGVSEAAMYKHFSGKEDMALYIFTAVITEYTGRLLKVNEQQIPAIDKLCRIVELTYNLYESFPDEIRFALLSQYNFWDRVPDQVKPHFVIKDIVLRGMADGQIKTPEVYFAITMFSGIMLQPLAQYEYFRDSLPKISELGKLVEDVVRKAFT